MALGARLEFRQSQQLVMTPQLLQAIKLLQLSTTDLNAYVDAELEKNPLLERVEAAPDAAAPGPVEPSSDDGGAAGPAEGDWAAAEMPTSREALERDLGTGVDNLYADEAAPAPLEREARERDLRDDGPTLPGMEGVGRGAGGASLDDADANLEAYVAAGVTLHDHLERQVALMAAPPLIRAFGVALVAVIDDCGYLSEPLEEAAARLGAGVAEAEAALALVQACDPAGVGARSLKECLALQLKERDRHDPAMARLLDHLDLLAKRDYAGLARRCGVDDEDLREMVAEVRRLDPKPGLAFGRPTSGVVTPDVVVRAAPDGSWIVELNHDALPRVIANRAYYARVSRGTKGEARAFVDESWASANWLARSLEQRARTVLKVASEIVRQQDGFLVSGVGSLRPLNLKTVAEAVGLHESTVSRVTANKYVMTHRGTFEMKYFFTASIQATRGGEAHSAEAVRHRIRGLVDAEGDEPLSDDAIVAALRAQGVDIARRTVAKYRDALRIPSSAARRRERQHAKGSGAAGGAAPA